MQEKKIIVEHSTVNLAFQVEKLIHEGWKIDEKHPFQSIGVHYECGLVKIEEEEVKELFEKVVTETMTDAEVGQHLIDTAFGFKDKEEAPKAPARQTGRPKSK